MTSRREFLSRIAAVGGFGAAYTSLRALGMTGGNKKPASAGRTLR